VNYFILFHATTIANIKNRTKNGTNPIIAPTTSTIVEKFPKNMRPKNNKSETMSVPIMAKVPPITPNTLRTITTKIAKTMAMIEARRVPIDTTDTTTSATKATTKANKLNSMKAVTFVGI